MKGTAGQIKEYLKEISERARFRFDQANSEDNVFGICDAYGQLQGAIIAACADLEQLDKAAQAQNGPGLIEITSRDVRWGFHDLLLAKGYELDRRFEADRGLRVYRKDNINSVDVFRDGSWRKYNGHDFVSGKSLAALAEAFGDVVNTKETV